MTDLNKNYDEMKEAALSFGASLFGVADITDKKEHIHLYDDEMLDRYGRAICLGYHLSDSVMDSIIDRPHKLYYRHYKMANIYLDQLALRLGEEIQRRGYSYLPIPASQVLDWDGCTAHASHRGMAVHAGLGWRGRSSLLVNHEFGARCRYVSMLTDMPLKTDKPVDNDCGTCRRCVALCPAGAITMDGYDMDKCHELLKHFGRTLHVSLICGVCQKACPGNNPLHRIGEKG